MTLPSRAAAVLLVGVLVLAAAACDADGGHADAAGRRAEAAAAVATAYDAFQEDLRAATSVPAAAVGTAFAGLGVELDGIQVPSALADEKADALAAVRAAARVFAAEAEAGPNEASATHAIVTSSALGEADQAIQALRAALAAPAP